MVADVIIIIVPHEYFFALLDVAECLYLDRFAALGRPSFGIPPASVTMSDHAVPRQEEFSVVETPPFQSQRRVHLLFSTPAATSEPPVPLRPRHHLRRRMALNVKNSLSVSVLISRFLALQHLC